MGPIIRVVYSSTANDFTVTKGPLSIRGLGRPDVRGDAHVRGAAGAHLRESR